MAFHAENVYISTCIDMNVSPSTLISKLITSSGHKHFEVTNGNNDENEFEKLLALRNQHNLQIVLHNYCLNTEEDFILNLALPRNNKNYIMSINLIKNNIIRSNKLGSKYYAVHAGFLFDLQVDELGGGVVKRQLIKNGIDNFLSSIVELADYAKQLDVQLLIENNVLIKDTYQKFGQSSPFLCVDPASTFKLFSEVQSVGIGLLLDWGHLKVSASTMDFKCSDYIERNYEFIKGIHLSENNGLEDSNDVLNVRSEVFEQHFPNVDYITLEVNNIRVNQISEQITLIKENL